MVETPTHNFYSMRITNTLASDGEERFESFTGSTDNQITFVALSEIILYHERNKAGIEVPNEENCF